MKMRRVWFAGANISGWSWGSELGRLRGEEWGGGEGRSKSCFVFLIFGCLSLFFCLRIEVLLAKAKNVLCVLSRWFKFGILCNEAFMECILLSL